MFVKAQKSQAKLRLALFGASGSGKTFTALRLAKGIGGKVALIDSENHTAAKYADRFDFDTCALEDKTIAAYVEAMNAAAIAGYNVLIIDSGSHAWQELLQEVDDLANAKFRGNTWSAWAIGTPKQKQFVQAIQTFPGHLIMTMRAKTEWSTEDDGRGKKKPVRVGLTPEQGKGIEYEFDMLGQISVDHTMEVLKDRTGQWQDKIIKMPGEDMGKELAAWLADGVPAQPRPVQAPAAAPAPAPAAEPSAPENPVLTERERVLALTEQWTGIPRTQRDDFVAALKRIAVACGLDPAQLAKGESLGAYQAMRAFIQRHKAAATDWIKASEPLATQTPADSSPPKETAPAAPTHAPETPKAPAAQPRAEWQTDAPEGSRPGSKPGQYITRVVIESASVIETGKSSGRSWTLSRVETDVGAFATFSTSLAELAGQEVDVEWALERGRRCIKSYQPVPKEEATPF